MSLLHLTKCCARSITTADQLLHDAREDRIPRDEQTREDFGFSRCRDWNEESHLFGLYQGLLLYLHIDSVQLNKWKQEGLLVSKITETFEKVPEANRGGYFPWFLRHQYILDYSTPLAKVAVLERAIDAAVMNLPPEERFEDLRQLEPPAKRDCFIFYALALISAHPNPNWVELDLWYDFGFAVCANEYDEGRLGSAYSKLVGGNRFFEEYDRSIGSGPSSLANVATCSFEEFWLAWQDGNLAKLFERYGLGNAFNSSYPPLQGIRFQDSSFLKFMSFPIKQHTLRPSVWRIKHLLALDDNQPLRNFPQIVAAGQEYGFTSHLNARTKIALRQFYRQLLENNDPLEVHEAKNRGELLRYAESRLENIEEGVQDVLRTLSPGKTK